jgi:hypothetical protein
MAVQISSPLLKGKVSSGVLLLLLYKFKNWHKIKNLGSKSVLLVAAAISRERPVEIEKISLPEWYRNSVFKRMLAYIETHGFTKEFFPRFWPYLLIYFAFLIFVFNRLLHFSKRVQKMIRRFKKLRNKKKFSFRDITIRDILMFFRQILIFCLYLLTKGFSLILIYDIFKFICDEKRYSYDRNYSYEYIFSGK